jgi:hypothetical protein
VELVSLAVSVTTLARLLETARDGFRYVRVGKEFGIDFQTLSLQLDNAQLWISKWGGTVDLVSHTSATTKLQNTPVPPEGITRGEAVLGQIVLLFQEAENITKKFPAKHSAEAGMEFDTIMTATRTLHTWMRDIRHQRQRDTSVSQKCKASHL